jgi:hypothetical protein
MRARGGEALHTRTITQVLFLLLTALAAAPSSAAPDLKLSAPLAPERDDRAFEGGVELRIRLESGVDLGVGMGVQRGPAAPAMLTRIHLKF